MAESREGWVLCEVQVCVDAEGNYVVGDSEADMAERYAEDYNSESLRLVKLAVWVELPKPVTLTGEAALTGQGAVLTVV